MRRLLSVLACLLMALTARVAPAGQNYQDMWWLPSESGWGLMVLHQADTISAVMFHYRADRSPAWYLLSNARHTPGEHFEGTLYEVKGPPLFGLFDPASVMPRAVGNMRLSFENGNQAQLQYTIDGQSTTRTIQRFSFAALEFDGGYFGSQAGVVRCEGNPQVGSYIFPAQIRVVDGQVFDTQMANSLVDQGAVFCNWGGVPQAQQGSRVVGSGIVYCNDNNGALIAQAEIEVEELRVVDHAITLNYRATVRYPPANAICRERGSFFGTRLQSPD
ncbi:MAG: hypothetical protein IT479_15985 [Xanthomonadales bacterium]|nr:hypothetical protein [Xanthomonadales bacterium]MCC6594762.1 hypothetical protein [Xanthomonadales bacterium]MCE7932831.1 hypothetical protein [Xanthomonadales bacterium PRO6]